MEERTVAKKRNQVDSRAERCNHAGLYSHYTKRP